MKNLPSTTIWLNGRFLESEKFSLSPFHSALTVGEGIFETLRGIDGYAEALPLHLQRLQIGADLFGFETPEIDLVREVFAELMNRQNLGKAKLRLTLARDTLLLTAEPLPDFPKSMAVVTLPFSRNENDILVGIKSTSYSQNILALNYAKEHGADEAIFGNTVGDLCEGSCTNVFVRYGDSWFTPPLCAGPLPGVTRHLVLKICAQHQIEILEKNTSLDQLEQADEMFITSSLRGVMPVHSINAQTLAAPKHSLLIQNLYSEHDI